MRTLKSEALTAATVKASMTHNASKAKGITVNDTTFSSTTTTSARPFIPTYNVDTHHVNNWLTDSPPATIINPESTLHARIAWCWGVASELEEIAALLANHIEDSERTVGGIFSTKLLPLVAMLEHLGTVTAKAHR